MGATDGAPFTGDYDHHHPDDHDHHRSDDYDDNGSANHHDVPANHGSADHNATHDHTTAGHPTSDHRGASTDHHGRPRTAAVSACGHRPGV